MGVENGGGSAPVSRVPVVVRPAVEADLPALVGIYAELREAAGRQDRQLPPPSERALGQRLRQIDDNPFARALVGELDGVVVALAVLAVRPMGSAYDGTAVHVDCVHVRSTMRRRGVGTALLAAAVVWSEEVGAESVVVSVAPHLRDSNRFFARRGLAPLTVRRSAPTAMLRRRLAADTGAAVLTGVGLRNDAVSRRRALTRARVALSRAGR